MNAVLKNPHLDRDGCKLQVGDIVRVIGVPDLTGMSQDAQDESKPVFEYLRNKFKKIKGFDEIGNAQLEFRLSRKEPPYCHTVWIEPFLLKKRIPRK
jgi:hypothetical protein